MNGCMHLLRLFCFVFVFFFVLFRRIFIVLTHKIYVFACLFDLATDFTAYFCHCMLFSSMNTNMQLQQNHIQIFLSWPKKRHLIVAQFKATEEQAKEDQAEKEQAAEEWATEEKPVQDVLTILNQSGKRSTIHQQVGHLLSQLLGQFKDTQAVLKSGKEPFLTKCLMMICGT